MFYNLKKLHDNDLPKNVKVESKEHCGCMGLTKPVPIFLLKSQLLSELIIFSSILDFSVLQAHLLNSEKRASFFVKTKGHCQELLGMIWIWPHCQDLV